MKNIAVKLAQAIVDDLFKNGCGDQAERLVLMAGHPPRELGGWGKVPMADRIARLLEASGFIRD